MTTDFGAVPFEDDPNGMRAVLAGLPDPGPMPGDVEARVLASLREEVRARSTAGPSGSAAAAVAAAPADVGARPRHSRDLGPASVPVTRGAPTDRPVPVDPPVAREIQVPDPAPLPRDLSRASRHHTTEDRVAALPSRSQRRQVAQPPASRHARRSGRAPKWFLGLAAACLVVVGGAKMLQSGLGSSADSAGGSSTYSDYAASRQSTESAAVGGGDGESSAATAAREGSGIFSRYVVSGRAFTDDGLTSQARALVTGRTIALASGPESDFFASSEQATVCLQLVSAPTDATTRVEVGTYGQIPAALISYSDPASPHTWTALVVGRQCGQATNDMLAGPVTFTATAK